MSERNTYRPGTPNWADLGTPDTAAAGEFYSQLFGWEFDPGENPEETAGYLSATLRGRAVGGVMPLMQEGQPPAWSTYVSVEDADAAIDSVKANGGSVVLEPMDVLDIGRLAFFADPTGAVCGVWQPKTFHGAELTGVPGAMSWIELETRDPAAAKEFYAAVFGWSFADQDMGAMGTYTEWKLGDESFGGMADISGRVPEEVPAHWIVYFAVEDADAVAERVRDGGGQVHFGPVDIPAGRFAMAADPWGAPFAVIRLADPS